MNEPRFTRGKITDFNIWSRHLSDVEMVQFTMVLNGENKGNKIIGSPDIVDWKQLNMGNTVGNIKIEENVRLKQVANCDKAIKLLDHGSISYNQVESINCNNNNQNVLMAFTKKLPFHTTSLMCKQLGGEMPLPTSKENIDEIITSAGWDKYDSSICSSIWLPIIEVGVNTSSYRHFDFHKQMRPSELEEISYLNWQFGQPNGPGIYISYLSLKYSNFILLFLLEIY